MNLKRFLVCAAVVVAVLAGGRRADAASILYGANGSGGALSTLFIIDPTTGSVSSTVGAIGFAVTGLAFDPITGILYGSTARAAGAPALITIDTATGAGTLVGLVGVASEALADIAFSPGGTLYGWLEPGNDDLATVNTATGQATVVGNAGISTAFAGLAIDSTGTVFFGGLSDGSTGLLPIDPVTGAPGVLIPYLPTLNVGLGMAFDDAGVLFAIHQLATGAAGGRNLVTINPTTGAVTTIGATVPGLDALAFSVTPTVPEPATMTLLLLGAGAGLARFRRRSL
jgi:hypothetical protein